MYLYYIFSLHYEEKLGKMHYILGVFCIKTERFSLPSWIHSSSFIKFKSFCLLILKQDESNKISAVTDVS
jgi:hypothetical protein